MSDNNESDLLVPGLPADYPVEVLGKGVFYNDQRGEYPPPEPEEVPEASDEPTSDPEPAPPQPVEDEPEDPFDDDEGDE